MSRDIIVVGAGPNGLAAAITLARAGRTVVLYEAKDTIGGGTRSAELTLPGFLHDICSAVHPLGLSSPFFRRLPLAVHGLEWIHPPIPLAHPFDDGTAALLQRSIQETSATLGQDAAAYQRVMDPLVAGWDSIIGAFLGPLRTAQFLEFTRHSFLFTSFGLHALRSAKGLAKKLYAGPRARALFAGLAAHSMVPLEHIPTAAFGLILGMSGHAVGWPIARGGSQQIANALAGYFRSLGGEIVTGAPITSLAEFQGARAVLFDVTPRQLLGIVGDRFPTRYRNQLERYRYGPGAFKVDWALDGPIPWKAPDCSLAGTVHIGGTLEEIAASERAAWRGGHAQKPYVLVAQQSLFDPTRAPEGKQTVWGYCHVPHGSTVDMTGRIEAQIERFAPGFRDRILARHVMSPASLEEYNANYIGGDINGGIQDIFQLFTRPTPRLVPYSTPAKGIYICSSSSPPGGGVHGMCGYFAAQAALSDIR